MITGFVFKRNVSVHIDDSYKTPNMLKNIYIKWMNYMLSELYLNKLFCFNVMDFITAFVDKFVFADPCPQLLPSPLSF